MPPKKSEAVLREDARLYAQWVYGHLEELRARSGYGLRGRLRQASGPEEKAVYNWVMRTVTRARLYPRLALDLRALDVLVDTGAYVSCPLAAGATPRAGFAGARSLSAVEEELLGAPEVSVYVRDFHIAIREHVGLPPRDSALGRRVVHVRRRYRMFVEGARGRNRPLQAKEVRLLALSDGAGGPLIGFGSARLLGDVSDAADTLAAAVRRLESILGTYAGFGQAVCTMKIAMRALGSVQAK